MKTNRVREDIAKLEETEFYLDLDEIFIKLNWKELKKN
jgi:hypothetical protein